MNRRELLKMFGMALPVAAVKPSYFFAPIGGWAKGRQIVSGVMPSLYGNMQPIQWTPIAPIVKVGLWSDKGSTLLERAIAQEQLDNFLSVIEASWRAVKVLDETKVRLPWR